MTLRSVIFNMLRQNLREIERKSFDNRLLLLLLFVCVCMLQGKLHAWWEQSISRLDGAMFNFAAVTENEILPCNIHLVCLLSNDDCYSRDTQKALF